MPWLPSDDFESVLANFSCTESEDKFAPFSTHSILAQAVQVSVHHHLLNAAHKSASTTFCSDFAGQSNSCTNRAAKGFEG
mmetsp:Transcript_2138/g.4922  ORF Transcript_2138/g.4922 Transcript_2138/m.4922 type:complete len:80 (+) Transcript_2138:1235-1474(+)